MIHSMTGFGGASFLVDGTAFDVEVRSVNHRHLDARVRLPRPLAALESDVRARIQTRFSRGKVDLTVVSPDGAATAPRLEFDVAVARAYLQAADQLGRDENVSGTLAVADVLALPGVARFSEPKLEGEMLSRAALDAVDAALTGLESMRATEGAALARDLLARLERVGELADALEGRAGLVQTAVRERLQKRARQLGAETGLLDEARLHQEIVMAADRLDYTEEIVRLRSHLDHFRSLADEAGPGQPVGRKLDFLLQEFGREANTIGSKGNDAPVAHFIVELKTEIERLREQVQNVE